jgi:hypothetical protein
MKNTVISGLLIYFLFTEAEKGNNNQSRLAPAVIVGRPWSDHCVNVLILCDGPASQTRSSVQRATSIEDFSNGNKWATKEQCEAWGIDLSDSYQDIQTLIPSTRDFGGGVPETTNAENGTKTEPATEQAEETDQDSGKGAD